MISDLKAEETEGGKVRFNFQHRGIISCNRERYIYYESAETSGAHEVFPAF